MKIQWSLIAGLVFALLTAIFAVINVDPVRVNLMFSEVNIPLILLIVGCTLIGGIIVGSYGIFRQYRLQKEIKLLSAQLAHIQSETGYTEPLPVEEMTKESNDKEQLQTP
ncbi:LapA family protein [Paenibacillus chibensis]|uniref:LapA family protein n=1 Tax=Paenibacillus chibensis TaxID=59846 RepID=UPI000FD6E5FB|nr:lipopolysaccharide assembly protein LapA domain-containing protein [Paenibacillus chibensis]MEC0369063.1 lipopolysaccharide assembly protein LapA domain-containing protein [Paenibacillus chibensis]